MVPQLDPEFEAMVEKEMTGGLNPTLGAADAAVSTGTVILWAAVVIPIVVVERGGRRCGEMSE
jgi:hypothetical protein